MEENILEQQFREDAESLIRFIDNSPSCYHVIDNIKKELRGYKELKENEDWELEPGKGYYVIRNSSSIIAFRIPGTMKSVENCGFLIAAAHSDSPAFKVKQNGEITVDKYYKKLNVEKYGGMIIAPWLDRPLSVAGRIFVDEDGRLTERLVNIDRDLLIIPNVAIHMNRDINENCKYSMRTDMQPLLGLTKSCGIGHDTLRETFKDEKNYKNIITDDNKGGDEDNKKVTIYKYTNTDRCTTTYTDTNRKSGLSRDDKDTLTGMVAESIGVDADSILSMDLFLYPRVSGTFLGAENELIAARTLDDLQCAYSIVQGFVRSGKYASPMSADDSANGNSLSEENTDCKENESVLRNSAVADTTDYKLNTESITEGITGALNSGCMIPVCCVFDNEEVGSGTRQGADSDFLHDVLYRMTEAFININEGNVRGTDANCELLKMLANSFMISADNAHAVHPNHPEYADESDRPYLNGGVVVKFNAAQKYTTDAYSYAILKKIARRANVPLQTYSNRPDIAGGSTLGNISVRHVSVPCVDIGLPQLAMHSCYETAGAYDTRYMIELLEEYYRCGSSC